MRLPAGQLAETTRELTETFISGHFPEEAPYLPLIWRRFLASGTGQDAHPGKGAGRKLLEIGLGFAKGKSLRLAAPFVLAAVSSSLVQLGEEENLPSLSQVEESVAESAHAFGAPKTLTQKLVSSLAPALFALFSELEASDSDLFPAEISAVSAAESGDSLRVEWLVNGRLKRERLSRKSAASRLTSHPFDLAINEPEDTIRLGTNTKSRPQALYKISRQIRSMLWLILTHIGRGVSYDEIAERLGFEPGLNLADRDNRIHGLRGRVGAFLGQGLADKVFGEGAQKIYPIRKEDWSFCWVREKEADASDLLLGVPEMPDS